MAAKKPETSKPKKRKPGPKTERLVIPKGKASEALDRLLGRGHEPARTRQDSRRRG